jgi:hypothetical protein
VTGKDVEPGSESRIADLIEEGNRLENTLSDTEPAKGDQGLGSEPRAELWNDVAATTTDSDLKSRLAEWLRRAI